MKIEDNIQAKIRLTEHYRLYKETLDEEGAIIDQEIVATIENVEDLKFALDPKEGEYTYPAPGYEVEEVEGPDEGYEALAWTHGP